MQRKSNYLLRIKKGLCWIGLLILLAGLVYYFFVKSHPAQISPFSNPTQPLDVKGISIEHYNPDSHKDIIVPYIEGGIGNQLYFVAQAFIYAKRFNKTLYLKYESSHPSYGKPRPTYFDTIFSKIHVLDIPADKLNKFTKINENELDVERPGSVMLAGGYFQKTKYIMDNIASIQELFQPNTQILEDVNKLISHYNINPTHDIFLHIRLGDDWTPHDFGNVYTPQEIDTIRAFINKNIASTIIVFSNNPDKARELLNINNAKLVIIKPVYNIKLNTAQDIAELYLIAQGRRFIASPSTFMIWGIMLSNKPNKEIEILWDTNSNDYRRDFYNQYLPLLNKSGQPLNENQPSPISKYYVINLEKATDRLAKVNSQAHKLGINITRFNAIYGKALSATDPAKLKYIAPNTNLNPGQIGCALSHILLLEQINNDTSISQDDIICIFEDDIILPDDFIAKSTEFINNLNQLEPNWLIGQLGVLLCNGYKTEYPGIIKAYPGNMNYGLHAYLLHKRDVKYILETIQTKKINIPIDDFLITNFYNTRTYIINPVLVKQDRALASDIGVGLNINDYTCSIKI